MAKLTGRGSNGGATNEALREWRHHGSKLYDAFTVSGLRVDAIQPGRVLCSFTIPPRLTNASSKRMHGGAVASLVDLVGSAVFFAGGSPKTGVTVEITVSYLDAAHANEEIEIEARVLGIGETTGCVTVEVRRKGTGEVLAHGRITKYLAVSSKL
uniref:Acyl-coenzyme A thioesterase 13 n=1 Tax=Oryza punctata TaxID=4537 RepID=A0A0E0JRU6_ORYPU